MIHGRTDLVRYEKGLGNQKETAEFMAEHAAKWAWNGKGEAYLHSLTSVTGDEKFTTFFSCSLEFCFNIHREYLAACSLEYGVHKYF